MKNIVSAEPLLFRIRTFHKLRWLNLYTSKIRTFPIFNQSHPYRLLLLSNTARLFPLFNSLNLSSWRSTSFLLYLSSPYLTYRFLLPLQNIKSSRFNCKRAFKVKRVIYWQNHWRSLKSTNKRDCKYKSKEEMKSMKV